MFKVIKKQLLTPDIKRLDIVAPKIAKKFRPGQFVVIRPPGSGSTVSLPIVETASYRKTFAVIFKTEGNVKTKLGEVKIGDDIPYVLGPLGHPATIKKFGVVVCVAEGIDIAKILPLCRALKKSENRVIGIISAKTKKELILDPQMRVACHKILITTDDGSCVKKGSAKNALSEFLQNRKADMVFSVGSVDMLKDIADITRKYDTKNLAQLVPSMLDGTGITGFSRVDIGGEQVLASVRGLEFDGHLIDFEKFEKRLKTLEEIEKCSDQISLPEEKRNDSAILKKFLSGFPKK